MSSPRSAAANITITVVFIDVITPITPTFVARSGPGLLLGTSPEVLSNGTDRRTLGLFFDGDDRQENISASSALTTTTTVVLEWGGLTSETTLRRQTRHPAAGATATILSRDAILSSDARVRVEFSLRDACVAPSSFVHPAPPSVRPPAVSTCRFSLCYTPCSICCLTLNGSHLRRTGRDLHSVLSHSSTPLLRNGEPTDLCSLSLHHESHSLHLHTICVVRGT